MSDAAEIDRAVAAHDAALAALGLEIWVGNEPTFTDRRSQAAEWLTGAVGEGKRQRAESLLAALACERPGYAVLRSIGRQYPGEEEPRSSIGLYGRRDGQRSWCGPPDPLLLSRDPGPVDLAAFDAGLAAVLSEKGFVQRRFAGPMDLRHLFARADRGPLPGPADDARLLRPSIHAGPIPPEGLRDELARDGLFLLMLAEETVSGRTTACVELPAVEDVALFLALLEAVGEAAERSRLSSLVLRGHPPPVDASVSWSSVTPDPAVVEVNSAPYPDVAAFLSYNRACYAAAGALGLAPYRLYYNGTVADSGGGGQITLGGPSPARSPFFVTPQLLARLVLHVARHPSISYLFAHEHVGSFGQSVRPDELGADVLTELRLALALLARQPEPTPATIWQSLAPFLTDAAGNSHRAEINVEKLWNPGLPGRGMLGLVEFRAFRMQHTPERAAALAALLRSILARLMTGGEALDRADLPEWRGELHDRFALPFYLEADLREVLADLRRCGVALEPALAHELEIDHWRQWATFEIGDVAIGIRRALDFCFLLGDASNQQGTSRLVDASTSRIEVSLRPTGAAAAGDALAGWRVRANDVELPLRAEADPRGPVRLFGVRYRSFVPQPGLHPTLGKQSPVRLLLTNPAQTAAHEITLYDWPPDGSAYDGVPADLADARARRAARCVLRRLPPGAVPPARSIAPWAIGAFTLDLRYT